MASANIRELEARIRADREALAENRRRLRQAVEGRLGSPKGLLAGFAAGLAGGWILKGPTRNRQIRRLERELERERSQGRSRPSGGGRLDSLVSLLPLVTMGMRFASLARGAPPEAGAGPEDIPSSGGG